jgi:hypothetical protein
MSDGPRGSRGSRGFDVDADRLTARAGEFPGLAERAGAIHRELSEALTAVGPCWGNDSVGRSFAAAHVEPADATLGALGSLPSRLGAVGTRFGDTAAAYRDLDARGAQHLTAADDG